MPPVPASLGFVWTAGCLAAVSGGWGLRLVRTLDLPAWFVAPLGVATFAAGAYGVFFAFVAGPATGRAFAWAWLLASLAVLVVELRSHDGAGRLASRDTWLPATLAATLAAAYLALLFAAPEPLATRFTWELPPDNVIPRLLADRFWAGEPVRPFLGDWTSSDRPPLQTALDLALRPIHLEASREMHYQHLATLAQLSWLPAAYALARTAGLGPGALAPVLLAMAGTGFLLLNAVFTWPKLFAAALFLTSLALVAASARTRAFPIRMAVAGGGTISLALLAHGSVAFSVLALPAWPMAWRWARARGWTGVATAAAAAAALLLPWVAYQRLYDPPGDRLVKYHLAGVEEVDTRSVGRAIVDAYAVTPRDRLLEARRHNLRTVLLPPDRDPREPWDFWVRRSQFYHLGPMLGVLIVAIAGTAWRAARPRASAPERAAGGWLVHAGATLALWIAVMFLPGSTVTHQGSYVPILLLFLASGPALAAWTPALPAGVLILHLGVNLWAWVLTTPPPHAGASVPGSVSAAGMAAALLLFAGCCLLIALIPAGGEDRSSRPGSSASRARRVRSPAPGGSAR